MYLLFHGLIKKMLPIDLYVLYSLIMLIVSCPFWIRIYSMLNCNIFALYASYSYVLLLSGQILIFQTVSELDIGPLGAGVTFHNYATIWPCLSHTFYTFKKKKTGKENNQLCPLCVTQAFHSISNLT